MLRQTSNNEGIALIMVLVILALLSTLTVEYMYSTRLNYGLSVNSYDNVKAKYLAQSGVNFALLVLRMQDKIKEVSKKAGLGSASVIWKQVPISSNLLRGLVQGDTGETSALSPTQDLSHIQMERLNDFLGFEGDFSAQIADESAKLNINLFRELSGSKRDFLLRVFELSMMGDGEYDYLFQKNGRLAIIHSIIDWVDADNRLYGTSGMEDSAYSSLSDPFKPRNDKFDSIAELIMVDKVSDDWIDKFASMLTIYGEQVNITQASSGLLKALIIAAAEQVQERQKKEDVKAPLPVPQEMDVFVEEFLKVRDSTAYEMQTFLDVLKNYFPLIPFKKEDFADQITFSSTTYSIIAQGQVGETIKTAHAVVKHEDNEAKFLYWRES